MLWLCINSYTETLQFDVFCSHCLKQIQIDVDLRNIENATLPEDFKSVTEIEFTDGSKVNVRLFNLGDMIDIEKYEQEHENSHIYKYALTIVDEDSIQKRVEKLTNLPVKDLAKLRAFQQKYIHGPLMTYNMVCPDCGEEEIFELPFRIDIIFPDGETLANSFGEGI
jgi:hypothetical protein